MKIDPAKIHYTNHDITFEWSDEPSLALADGNGQSDLDFFVHLHDQSWQAMTAARARASAEPVLARGAVPELLTQPELWIVIGATCLAAVPTVFKSVFALLWHDIWGKEYIFAADVHTQNKEMIERFEYLVTQHQKQAKKNVTLAANVAEMASQLRRLPEAVAQKTASLLVKDLMWKKSKATSGVSIVSQTVSNDNR